MLYSVFSTKVIRFSCVFIHAFKCHHIIFIQIKSQMNHKPMKTACLFADYRQFVLGNGP